MIKMRLIRLLRGVRKYIVLQILWQWLSLLVQVVIAWNIAGLIEEARNRTLGTDRILVALVTVLLGLSLRAVCDRLYTAASFRASADVKRMLRGRIYQKILRLGPSYREQISSAELVQMSGEGVEQLETYFGRYLSQFFYALLAPLTLFFVLSPIDLRTATLLLLAVPLIPVVIMLVMTVAKRLLSRYFDIYYGLGDSFLEKLQGMTTLKIYQADRAAAYDMDRESERFRKITMKVLTMQLNSTSVMDIIAYGGAAVGIVSALTRFASGELSLAGVLMFILLAAEFFLPMRILGSFFHIGMQVCEELAKQGIEATLINPLFINEIDLSLLDELKPDHKLVVTLEDALLHGGFGSRIAQYYSMHSMKVMNKGFYKPVPTTYVADDFMRENRLLPEQITEDIVKMFTL